jgi:4-amino-4-deoxy-L-arabinose transferase-like glycosyltransferase
MNRFAMSPATSADISRRAGRRSLHDASYSEPPAGSGRPVIRAALLLFAAAIGAVAVLHPFFRHAEGHLATAAALPLALAAAVALQGFAAGSAWARSAGWLGLAVAGQAVALQIMNAGFMVGHQHYPAPAELMHGGNLAGVLFVLLQAAVVLRAARTRLIAWIQAARNAVGGWGLAGAGVAMVLTSSTLSQQIPIYIAELALASFVQLVNLVTIVLAVSALPQDRADVLGARLSRVFGARDGAEGPGGLDRFAVAAALWILLVCSLLAWFAYQNHPHVPDEVVYLYHARYFAQGLLSLPLPEVPAAFNLDLMTYEADRWYSPVPPGWPAALSLGVLMGAAWLVNPVLNALNVLLAYVLLRGMFDRRTARIATLLLCASPWFIFMGMNFMTHTFTLTCALGAAVCVLRLRRGRSVAWTIPGGIAIGVMGLIRPLEGLVMAVLLGLWTAGWPWSARSVVRVACLAIVSLAVGALAFPYNAHLTGSATTFPLMAYTDAIYGAGTNALGFGANRGLGWPGLDPLPGHGALDVLVNANLNAHGVNVELLGWSIGSLLPILLLLAMRRISRPDWWMLAVVASIAGVHSLYWFSGGPDFGARYWYLMLVPCIALTARAVVVVGERLARTPADVSATSDRVLAGALALALVSVVCFIPWRAVDKYYHYRNMRPDVRYLAAEHDFGRSLVLIRGNRHPDYASAAIYNPLDLRADVPVYVWDRGTETTRQVLSAYPDRPVWIVDGPTETGTGFRVRAGPLRAEALLAELTAAP